MLSSPSGVVEVEVSKYNMVNRGVLEQKMEQRKYIFCIRRDRKSVRKGGNSRLSIVEVPIPLEGVARIEDDVEDREVVVVGRSLLAAGQSLGIGCESRNKNRKHFDNS
jgi:hypothetical protein